MFCPGWQIFLGCFVRGVKKWHGMFCPGMFCPAPLIYGDKIGTCKSERAIGMLQANVTPLIVAERFRCHVRTIGRLKNCFRQIGTTSHRPRPGRRRVSTRRQDRDIQTSHLCNRFYLESVTARTAHGTHITKIRAQTVRNRFMKFV